MEGVDKGHVEGLTFGGEDLLRWVGVLRNVGGERNVDGVDKQVGRRVNRWR